MSIVESHPSFVRRAANVCNGWKAAIDYLPSQRVNGTMRDELIAQVQLDGHGRLLLKPAETLFDDLHTAGAWGFRWDVPTSSLAIPLPRDWSYRNWFDHVVEKIGREYGIHLKVGPDTQWIAVPASLRDDIEAAI
jgi:hypothetical protein